MVAHRQQQHFLLVCFPVQSHINPALQLARTLTRAGALVNYSTAISAHRKMFPDNPNAFPLDDPHDPLLSYYPFTDGYDDGYNPNEHSDADYKFTIKVIGSDSIYAVATTPGRPAITCVIYAIMLQWVAGVGRRLGVPSALYWIQPAAVFAVYHHYFHGHKEHIDSCSKDPSFVLELPGLPPLRARDLPSFLVRGKEPGIYDFVISSFQESYEVLDKETVENGGARPRVLVNSFDSLEREVIAALQKYAEVIPIGPVLPSVCLGDTVDQKSDNGFGADLIQNPDRKGHMEWLDRWPEKSVVYLSFGSISLLGKRQKEEFARELAGLGRPFLWVVRGDREGAEEAEAAENGMVVGWCKQVEVLSHRSVGCFVTHHGWNSTLESLSCGVPTVGMPQWTDQPTNARLAEGLWGTGVRAVVNEEGVVEGEELRRCVELVMGGTEDGAEIRRRAAMWKERAREAVREGGSADRNLKEFMNGTGFRI